MQEFVHIGLEIVAVAPGIARRIHTRRPAQGLHFQTGVVCKAARNVLCPAAQVFRLL